MRLHLILNDSPESFGTHPGLSDLLCGLRLFVDVPPALCHLRLQLISLSDAIDAFIASRGDLVKMRNVGRMARDVAIALSPLARSHEIWNLSESEADRIRCAASLIRRSAIRLGVHVDEKMLSAAFRVLIDNMPRDDADLLDWISQKTIPERQRLWKLLRDAVDSAEVSSLNHMPAPRRRSFSSIVDVSVGVIEWAQRLDFA